MANCSQLRTILWRVNCHNDTNLTDLSVVLDFIDALIVLLSRAQTISFDYRTTNSKKKTMKFVEDISNLYTLVADTVANRMKANKLSTNLTALVTDKKISVTNRSLILQQICLVMTMALKSIRTTLREISVSTQWIKNTINLSLEIEDFEYDVLGKDFKLEVLGVLN